MISIVDITSTSKILCNAAWAATFVAYGTCSLHLPLSGALDFVAHEWGHAVTEKAAVRGENLIYEKESGKKDIKVWGYRNVWYRFDPSEANIFVPVSLCMFNVMHEAFQNAFLSQKNASFPSYEHDGPFSELAQRIQVEQYQKIKTCLGREWFYDHSSPLIRATRGFVFLKEMEPEEFYQSCRVLKRSIENGV